LLQAALELTLAELLAFLHHLLLFVDQEDAVTALKKKVVNQLDFSTLGLAQRLDRAKLVDNVSVSLINLLVEESLGWGHLDLQLDLVQVSKHVLKLVLEGLEHVGVENLPDVLDVVQRADV
jgi:hypothetical protein